MKTAPETLLQTEQLHQDRIKSCVSVDSTLTLWCEREIEQPQNVMMENKH